jgi:hypothetical protein
MRLQYLRCGAAPVSHDGGEHDRPVDVTPPAAARRSRGCFQNSPHVLRNPKAHRRFGGIGIGLRKLSDDVGLESGDVDVACVEHRDGVTIIAERRQDMLERDVQSSGGGRELRAARKRCAKIRRHGNLTKLSGSYAHDVSNGQVGLGRTIKSMSAQAHVAKLTREKATAMPRRCADGNPPSLPNRVPPASGKLFDPQMREFH